MHADEGESFLRQSDEKLPGHALALSMAKVWEVVREHKDLNLPAHRVSAGGRARSGGGRSGSWQGRRGVDRLHRAGLPCTPREAYQAARSKGS